jgi:hypothetical protein
MEGRTQPFLVVFFPSRADKQEAERSADKAKFPSCVLDTFLRNRDGLSQKARSLLEIFFAPI